MKTILVTGSAGFIGANLVLRLLQDADVFGQCGMLSGAVGTPSLTDSERESGYNYFSHVETLTVDGTNALTLPTRTPLLFIHSGKIDVRVADGQPLHTQMSASSHLILPHRKAA